MADNSKIAWTQSTWNPVTGCTEISPGCDNCYAKTLAEKRRGTPAFPVGFDLQLRPHKLDDPLKWREPRMIFVNSMSDLFHRGIPDEYLMRVWDRMVRADRHTFQVLTKRAHRMEHKIRTLELPTPPHIWLGVSAENQAMADSRIPALLRIPAPVRFVSAEPLLGPLDLTRYMWLASVSPLGIHWCIVGGESGPGRRPMEYGWVRDLRDQCLLHDVAFFFKQGNGFRPGEDRQLDGRTWDEFPVPVAA